tara:strand:- start:32670 stop:34010 length:1341 start_codon:yes stop_codon:yes gene_type:complete
LLFRENKIIDIFKFISVLLFLFVSVVSGVGVYQGSHFFSLDKDIVLCFKISSILFIFFVFVGAKHINLKGFVPLFLFFVFALGASFFSDNYFLSLKRFILILGEGAVVAILMASYPDPKMVLRTLGYVLFGICIISLLWSLVVFVFGHWIDAEQGRSIRSIEIFNVSYGYSFGLRDIGFLNLLWERPAGVTSNPNSLAVYSVFLLFLSFIFKGERSNYFICFFIVSVIVSVIVLSRGQVIFILFSSFFYFLSFRDCPRVRVLLLMFSAGIPVFIAGFVIWSSTLSYDIPFLSVNRVAGEEVFSINERALPWRVVLSDAMDHPLWGKGFGIVQESILEPAGVFSAAYSVPFSMLSELGVLGVICFYWFWFSPLIKFSFESPVTRERAVVGALLVGIFVHQCFDSSVLRYHPFNSLFFILYGLLLNPKLSAGADRSGLATKEVGFGRV